MKIINVFDLDCHNVAKLICNQIIDFLLQYCNNNMQMMWKVYNGKHYILSLQYYQLALAYFLNFRKAWGTSVI